jgi:hypothetical protein
MDGLVQCGNSSSSSSNSSILCWCLPDILLLLLLVLLLLFVSLFILGGVTTSHYIVLHKPKTTKIPYTTSVDGVDKARGWQYCKGGMNNKIES